ncbi:MAG: hypothetical protein AAGA03_13655, partial [Planctomycetota bacterium]
HRHHRELHLGAARDEQHVIAVRQSEQLRDILLGRLQDVAELRRAMAQVPLRVERGAAAMMRRENASG